MFRCSKSCRGFQVSEVITLCVKLECNVNCYSGNLYICPTVFVREAVNKSFFLVRFFSIIIIIHYIYTALFSALKALYIERGISSTQ